MRSHPTTTNSQEWEDDRVLLPIYREGDRLPDDPDAVLLPILTRPAPVAQPRNDGTFDEHPWCRQRARAIGLLVGAGFVAGLVAAAIVWAVIR